MKTQNMKAGIEDEDGEIKVYDDQAYIVSDGEMFRFERTSGVSVNWAAIRNLEEGPYEQHNLQVSLEGQLCGQTTSLQGDSASQILANMDSVAHCDFSQDRNGQHMAYEGSHAVKTAQFAMQYYLFAQKHLWSKVQTLNSYLLAQNQERDKLQKLNDRQKHKLKKQRHLSSKLNEQAIHFEVLIQKMRPDLMEKCTQSANAALLRRKDIRLVDPDDERRAVKDILTEQGLLKEGQETIVYDKVAYGHLRDKENSANNHQKQVDKMDQIFEELKALKEQLASIQDQGVQVREQPEAKRRSSPTKRKYSSPGRSEATSPAPESGKKKQGEAAPGGSQPLEESIRSDVPSVTNKAVNDLNGLESSSKLEESASSQGGPKMRRVRNPYGSSDLSASQKSSHSVSQSFQKSKRRIEIEKVSDNDGAADDSYQDDDFEEAMASQKSNEKQRLSQQLQAEKLDKTNQRQKQINRSGSKLRQGQSKKDATPIKEEDGEDDVSAQDEAERDGQVQGRRSREADRAQEAYAAFERDSGGDDFAHDMLKIEEQSKSASNSVPLEDPSGSASGTYMPSLVEKARNLGGTDSRNPGFQGRLHQVSQVEESSSFNDESLLRNAQQLHAALQQTQPAENRSGAGTSLGSKYNNQRAAGSSTGKTQQTSAQEQAKRAKAEAEEEDEDEEYSLNDKYSDDFDVEEEDESASMPASQAQPATNLRQGPGTGAYGISEHQRTKADFIDVNVSASASLLPPLAGGGKGADNYQSSPANAASAINQQRNTGQKRADLKPENFALNLAESQQSIDFEFSESKTMLGGVAGFGPSATDMGAGNLANKSKRPSGQMGTHSGKVSSKQGGDDGGFGVSGSMDSHAFDLSESNFSMSKRSGSGAGPDARAQRLAQSRQKGGDPPKKKEFYQFQGNKFTSYTGDNQSAGDDDDAFN